MSLKLFTLPVISKAFCQIFFLFFFFLSFHFQLLSFLLHPVFHLQTCPKIFLEFRAARREDQQWMFLLAFPLHRIFLPTQLGDFLQKSKMNSVLLSPLVPGSAKYAFCLTEAEKESKAIEHE